LPSPTWPKSSSRTGRPRKKTAQPTPSWNAEEAGNMNILASNMADISTPDAGILALLCYGVVFLGLVLLMVVIILMGKYTKLIPYCVKNQKHYIAEFMFGIRTDTEDIWGTEILKKEPSFHTDEELKRTADSFVGETDQVPPMYSALKKNGRPLYSYAREGIEIERKARRITVDSLTVSRIGENRFCMDAVVSEGTYIRSLIRDFADALGEEAAMTSLKRTAIEHIKVEDVLIDGKSTDDVGDLVIKDREMLSESGIVLVSATISKHDKVLLVGPEITTRGFIYVKDSAEIIKGMKDICAGVIERNITPTYVDYNKIKNEIREELSRYLFEETECKPMIIAVVQEV
jgi:tRNA pseudouridine(55) synthase